MKYKAARKRRTYTIARDWRRCYHLLMKKPSLALFLATLAAAGILSACSPKFDWRDYRSPDAQFTALFPGKPAVLTREIDLDGRKISLTMTASEVDGNTFAIGSALLDSAEQAQAALPAMQTALLKNINGTVRSEKSASTASSTAAGTHQRSSLSIEAKGTQQGKPVLLVGRFVAQDKRIFQIIILGEESKLSRDTIDTFMDSVKLD
ncbi:hypothetical protein JAB5_51850 [Janthinobacterium sp. HH103]|uniref:hypothetical protein n=1 Tax=unclassified Janthinobacterium TaxID=2610881 RepID=UPI000893800D|nr:MULTISPECIES: hypothetical protein [unclassified Janthinobacterium]OEZ67934.1 hypothetical protein JAB5_51850 [Janthinobacterium sp. HH103]OEZ68402.1 hypothetical protein JAB2_18140 [Janthinobacterium sp. HH100]QOU71544.1 hypothetical protein JAB4_009550 [Janthinobacterium sp. HH102]